MESLSIVMRLDIDVSTAEIGDATSSHTLHLKIEQNVMVRESVL